MFLACAGSATDDSAVSGPLDMAQLVVEGTPDRNVGSAVFDLGDVDGDGAHELGVAWSYQDTFAEGQRLAVFPGNRRGTLQVEDAITLLVNDEGLGWFVDTGQCGGDGVSGHDNVVSIGDIDGDGLAELAVSFAVDAGLGTVRIFGGDQLLSGQTVGTSSARWHLYGYTNTWAFGTDLAVGDFDGDAVADLIVSAPLTDVPERAGSFYVVYGNRLATRPPGVVYANEVAGYVEGVVIGELLGDRVEAVGDVTGDGLDDLAVLAPACFQGGVGAIYLVSGAALPPRGYRDGLVPFGRYDQAGSGNGLEANLVALGDADGDGLPDLALGGDAGDEGPEVRVLDGRALAEGGLVTHRAAFRTGADSASQLAPLRTAGHTELLAHDGSVVVRVPDPLSASGWHHAENWPVPCQDGERSRRRRLLVAADFDGDGAEEVAVGDPAWPCTDDEDALGVVMVLNP